jgi:hypothetical protein
MICRVPRIRVDLRLGHEAKTCLLDLGDDPVFTQVASCTRQRLLKKSLSSPIVVRTVESTRS